MRNPLISIAVAAAMVSSLGLTADSTQAIPQEADFVAQYNRNVRSLYIDSFTADPISDLEPGTELVFILEGTPQARATFSIDGVISNQRMREVSPGVYEGRYVIRRQDVFSSNNPNVIATLRSGNESVRAQLDQNSFADNRGSFSDRSNTQLPLEVISPQNNSSVNGTVEVTGRSAPNATVNVNVKAVNSLGGIVGLNRDVFSQSVRTDNRGNFNFSFQPRLNVPGTRYEISLSAIRGNQTAVESLVLIQQ